MISLSTGRRTKEVLFHLEKFHRDKNKNNHLEKLHRDKNENILRDKVVYSFKFISSKEY